MMVEDTHKKNLKSISLQVKQTLRSLKIKIEYILNTSSN